MKKYIVDSDIYIDFLRTGKYHSVIKDLYVFNTPGVYFSSVVIQELLTGAIGKEGRKNVQILFGPFEKAGRIVTPTLNVWKEAGNVLSLLRQKKVGFGAKIPKMINDTLIALSAKSIGASICTSNAKDFQNLNTIFNFSLLVVSKDK